jgi:hypothetical protein
MSRVPAARSARGLCARLREPHHALSKRLANVLTIRFKERGPRVSPPTPLAVFGGRGRARKRSGQLSVAADPHRGIRRPRPHVIRVLECTHRWSEPLRNTRSQQELMPVAQSSPMSLDAPPSLFRPPLVLPPSRIRSRQQPVAFSKSNPCTPRPWDFPLAHGSHHAASCHTPSTSSGRRKGVHIVETP